MYGGGDTSNLLVPETPKLKEEANQKQSCTPYLAANLALLNDLACNNLNFQNLLVMQNLFTLGMEVDITKILSTGQRHHQNTENSHSSGRGRYHGKHIKSHHTVFENNQRPVQNYYPADVVIGYPAPECPTPSIQDHQMKIQTVTTDQSNYASSRDASQWNSSHYPSGDEADVRSGSHQMEGSSNLEDGFAESVEMERTHKRVSQNPMSSHYNAAEDVKGALIRCKSWPDPSNSPSPSMDHENHDLRFQLEDGDVVEYPSFMTCEEQKVDLNSDLERFIDIATPTISIDSKTEIMTDDIWEFYQLPSIYGLQVPFFKGSKRVSFAYFVPSLSAIRMFIPVSPIKSEEEEGESSPQRYVCDVQGWPRYLKLVYEFSEKLVPHVRPPFCNRLQELMEKGTPDKQIPNLPLSDVHPASWFAVAWYPAYCIPEGKLRTSFLTFHSFGLQQQKQQQEQQQQQQNFNGTLESLQKYDLKGTTIGIKFLSLNKEAWIKPKRSFQWREETATKLSSTNLPPYLSPDHSETDQSNGYVPYMKSVQSPDPVSSSKSENKLLILNLEFFPPDGLSMHPPLVDYKSSVHQQRELEHIIEQLQSRAELYARSSYLQKMCGSGKHMEPARWWHSDFEFFHQRG
eukprot:g4923.t1